MRFENTHLASPAARVQAGARARKSLFAGVPALLAAVLLPALGLWPWGAFDAPQAAGAQVPVPAVSTPADPGRTEKGPWGTLSYMPIVISPPVEFIQRNLTPVRPLMWRFPARASQTVEAFLAAAGLERATVTSLMATAKAGTGSVPSIDITPTADVVRGLKPDARARIYGELALSPLNPAQQSAFRFFGQSVDRWLATAPISQTTRDLVEPLVYRQGDFLFFADLDLVRPEISDPNELQRLHKTLLRHVTMVATVQVDDPSHLDGIVEYWGRGGRRTDIRPVLESISATPGASIDITHLLPSLPRLNLYRYPRISPGDLERPLLANCLWTALNFFPMQPDDRFLVEDVALRALKQDYYFVQDNYQVGDLVTFSDRSGELFHIAVYLAGDLVFGKNGSSALAPWTILPLDHLNGHYASAYSKGWVVSYLRRRDL